MSHDRGCPCGKERNEYDSCVEPDCYKKENQIKEFKSLRDLNVQVNDMVTDGVTFPMYVHDISNTEHCIVGNTKWKWDNPKWILFSRAESEEKERTMIKKELERYVWIRADGEAKIIDTDIVELWQGPYFDREKDRIYRLGEEVEIRVTVAVKNKKPVYRENASGYRTPFENRD
jgi:hypothetical protein